METYPTFESRNPDEVAKEIQDKIIETCKTMPVGRAFLIPADDVVRSELAEIDTFIMARLYLFDGGGVRDYTFFTVLDQPDGSTMIYKIKEIPSRDK